MLSSLKHRIARANNYHRPRPGGDVFIFSTPRGGSTWLSELIVTQPGFKPSDEPFNLRDAPVASELAAHGIREWRDLYDPTKRDAMRDYVSSIASGKSGVTNPFFYRNHFRLVTRRTCFKILHGGEDRIPWFRETFSGHVVLLLRHPAPVSLSRKVLPRLETFLDSDYRHHFSSEQLAHAKRVVRTGTPLHKAVVDWCFQTAPPLANVEPEWLVITYEQLVLDPDPLLTSMARTLDLPRLDRIRSRLDVPSASTHQSDKSTRGVLSDAHDVASRRWLVEKWQERVESSELERAMESLAVFGIDVYHAESALPSERYWRHGSAVTVG